MVHFNYPVCEDSPHLGVDLHLDVNVVMWPVLMLQIRREETCSENATDMDHIFYTAKISAVT